MNTVLWFGLGVIFVVHWIFCGYLIHRIRVYQSWYRANMARLDSFRQAPDVTEGFESEATGRRR